MRTQYQSAPFPQLMWGVAFTAYVVFFSALFKYPFQQNTILFFFLSELMDLFVGGRSRPVSSRSAKQPG